MSWVEIKTNFKRKNKYIILLSFLLHLSYLMLLFINYFLINLDLFPDHTFYSHGTSYHEEQFEKYNYFFY